MTPRSAGRSLPRHSGDHIPAVALTLLEFIYNKLHPLIILHIQYSTTQKTLILLLQEMQRDIIHLHAQLSGPSHQEELHFCSKLVCCLENLFTPWISKSPDFLWIPPAACPYQRRPPWKLTLSQTITYALNNVACISEALFFHNLSYTTQPYSFPTLISYLTPPSLAQCII